MNDRGFSGVRGPEDLVGQTVADRYHLVHHLSSGANTIIFDAEDQQSQRAVTVKLLQPDLVVAAGFLERFDRTMHSASALSHPNLAAVYDWGAAHIAGSPTAFVVIERLSGGSLRDLYDRNRRLSPSQALTIGLEVCRGLDHAHRRGFVHGELSPAKLVFGEDRRVRIVDLGLSSLLAERMWAEPSSVPTHVARYASPEQALSMPMDGTTDVYALCLSLIEGVTGELPFAADSTVATLAARAGRLMPVSADLGPLAAVFERAGRPEAAERYTAAQFGRALVQAAEKLPRPEPLPLMTPSLFDVPAERLRSPQDPTGGVERPELIVLTHDDELPVDDVADDVGSPVEPVTDVDEEPAEEPAGEPAEEPAEEPADEPADPLDLVVLDVDDADVTRPMDRTPTASLPSLGGAGAAAGTDVAGIADVADIDDGPDRRSSWFVRILVPALILIAIAGLVMVAVRLFTVPSYEVPRLAGLEESEALGIIEDFDWDLAVELDRSDAEPRVGHVIRTVPAPGERLSRGEPFLMVVSEGPEFRVLPELRGLSFVDAERALADLALLSVLEEAHDEEVPRGGVVSWQVVGDESLVAGDLVLPENEVLLIVSSGPAPRVVPDMFGTPVSAARATLEELRLELVEVDPVFDDVAPPGTIAWQNPEAGSEVARGAVIEVATSLGPDLVIFPDLSGTTFPEAQQLLAAVDLDARLEFGATDGNFISARIDGEPVPAGEPVRRYSRVDLVFL